ncbi:MAG TPA: DNA-binding domain-containing protein [Steroidobacteraceae bacterium]|jgi:hypothetical protein
MQLAQLQRAFQNHVLHEDGSIAEQIQASADAPVAMRLEVYSQAYRLRLVDALAESYPQLRALIGSEAFADLGARYLQAYPSTNFSVRWFGDRLAVPLRELPEFHEQPWLAELAEWEWALAEAFDAADVEPLALIALASVEPSQWPSLRFKCHPSLQRLVTRTNAAALFKALATESGAPAPALLNDSRHWIIWRQDLATRYRSLDEDEALALRTLCEGGTFDAVCESLCDHHEPAAVPAIAAGMLKGWIVAGMMADVTSDE